MGRHRLDLPARMDSARMTTYHYHDAACWPDGQQEIIDRTVN